MSTEIKVQFQGKLSLYQFMSKYYSNDLHNDTTHAVSSLKYFIKYSSPDNGTINIFYRYDVYNMIHYY